MKKAKLTLTIDPHLLVNAKRLAKERGASLSGLVERFFESMLYSSKDSSEDSWVADMDQFLARMNDNLPDAKEIEAEIKRDHDPFEQELIDDLSQEFLK